MNRITIRRFDVVRTANIAAALYLVITLVIALVFALPIVLLVSVAGTQYAGDGMGAIMGAGVVGVLIFAVIASLVYAVMGWIITAIVVALYNFVAGRIGGLQVDVTIEGPMPGYGGQGGYGYPAQPAQPAQPAPPQGSGSGQPPVPPSGWGQPQA